MYLDRNQIFSIVYTSILLYVEDALKACVSQTHSVFVIHVLDNQKVAFNGGCSRKDGHHTAGKSLYQ